MAVASKGLQGGGNKGDMGCVCDHFGPTECEDIDEALSKIKQAGSLRDYRKKLERLGN